MMAADYRHIGGVENRLGRHYSRFSPFWPAASFADQSLALRKSWNAGSNRRSQARDSPSGGARRYATISLLRPGSSLSSVGPARQQWPVTDEEIQGQILFWPLEE